MIGASDEQLDVFNEVWYSVLLETGQTSKGMDLFLLFLNTRFFFFVSFDGTYVVFKCYSNQ